MIKSIMVACVFVAGIVVGGLAVAADGKTDSADNSAYTIAAAFAGLKSMRSIPETPLRTVPVAACSADCCCQIYDGSKMVYECRSHNACINDGGLCKAKTDAQCN